MRFGGHIRFEDVDTGDLDVEIEVDGTHVRLSSAGESLGSWCLADVVAARIVANEFSLDLNGDEVIFVADDPVNFAYGAVQSMAEGWARFRSMNVVRRAQAVASARRRNETQRLDEARRAFFAAQAELRELDLVPGEEIVDLVAEEGRAASPTPQPSLPEVPEAPPEGPVPWVVGEEPELVEQEVVVRIVERRATPAVEPAAPSRQAEIPAARATRLPGRMIRFNAFPGPEHVGSAPAARNDPDASDSAVSLPPADVPVESEPTSNPAPISPSPTYADGRHPAETSGLRASMKSVFARSSDPHEHTMVESTTAVGLTRKVCIECGYVSIGVSD